VTIRLHLRRLGYRFLGLFREVHTLRGIESSLNVKIHDQDRELRENRARIEGMSLELAECRRGLQVMTDARLNADRMVDLLRGELQGIREISQREIEGVRQIADCMALQALGRQVFGSAPQLIRPREDKSERDPRPITGRQAVSLGREQFIAEVERRLSAESSVTGESTSDVA
jgi:hypothetical protein